MVVSAPSLTHAWMIIFNMILLALNSNYRQSDQAILEKMIRKVLKAAFESR
jgi:hypothetical protein